MNAPPAVFFSYVRADDRSEQGRLSACRQALEAELRTQTGDEWTVFQDVEDIEIGEQWRKRLAEGLTDSTFFVPILTPRYLKSRFCRDELTQFLAKEKELGRDDLVFPLLYLDTPAITDVSGREHDLLAVTLAARNWDDWRALRLLSIQSAKVRQRVISLAKAIRSAHARPTDGARTVSSAPPPVSEYETATEARSSGDRDERATTAGVSVSPAQPPPLDNVTRTVLLKPDELEPFRQLPAEEEQAVIENRSDTGQASHTDSKKSLWAKLVRLYTRPVVQIGVALGSRHLTLFMPGHGVVLRERSLVAVRQGTNKLIAVGNDALEALDLGVDDLVPVYPVVRAGVADEPAAAALLSRSFKKIVPDPEAYLSVIATTPCGATSLQNRALRAAIRTAGAGDIYLLENPLAAAIGEGEMIEKRYCNAVVYCGATVTDAALVGQSRILFSSSVWLGSDAFDRAIMDHFKRNLNLVISETMATKIKEEIGTVGTTKERFIDVSGNDVIEGMPKLVKIGSQELRDILLDPMAAIFQCIRGLLARCPAELSPELTQRGFLLAGGGALLNGFDELVAEETHLPVRLAHNPVDVIAKGAADAFEILHALKKASRLR